MSRGEPQENTPRPGLRKGAEKIVNKRLKTADSIKYCPDPETRELKIASRFQPMGRLTSHCELHSGTVTSPFKKVDTKAKHLKI